jgi:phosphoadenosine phosphosulfate reductase
MSILDLNLANSKLADLTAEERIRWGAETFGDKLLLTTSFGTYSAVMLHLAKTVAPQIPLLSMDTGWTPETRAFAENLIRQLELEVHILTIPQPASEHKREDESELDYLGRMKTSLLEEALAQRGVKAWMSGVLGSETSLRKTFEILVERQDGLYKFHPILDWDSRRLYQYCEQHGLPTNDLYFDPLKGDDQKKECGIHQTGLPASSGG